MKNPNHPLLDKPVEVEVAGKGVPLRGKMIDLGQDIIVIRGASHFYYIPLVHVKQLRPASQEESTEAVPEMPYEPQSDPISYRKVLFNAKGMFSELYIAGSQSIHGYVTSVMNDYFTFYSPVYHTVIVSLSHLKYLSPYHPDVTPYTLPPEQFPLKPSPISLARTFDQQIRKLIGEFVVLDLGDHPNKTGILKQMEDGMIELANAAGQPVYIHFDHVKTVHVP
ncbi:MAG TPA: DUF2642 domain-containing protein [Paenibacillus sp.]|uniref:DUF2642 domain-containing protein n=1 Tax=Paenibacillus sp. TaxID=58172 RepID=UPI0028D7B0D3|nr:DUF2642 domain-containing protein [Paenibacillus sp.]HUC91707.1 DUF2642 domain-containing protein [Paenibacillus sp.]